MTSIEIAELVKSRHGKVKQSIDCLSKRGVIAFLPIGEKPTDGRPRTFYIFEGERGKRDSQAAKVVGTGRNRLFYSCVATVG
ncbi:hypothetical protein [Halomonas elongata]|uniref:hypothetical protein n=1 Tax=Halomonas elongata TaxID=2746 RepID=UPI004033E61A